MTNDERMILEQQRTINELRTKLQALRDDCCNAVQQRDDLEGKLKLAKAAFSIAVAAETELGGEREEMRAALIDCAAMLEHYVERRRGNWDGTTENQARAALVKARKIIAKEIA